MKGKAYEAYILAPNLMCGSNGLLENLTNAEPRGPALRFKMIEALSLPKPVNIRTLGA